MRKGLMKQLLNKMKLAYIHTETSTPNKENGTSEELVVWQSSRFMPSISLAYQRDLF